ncbi:2-polyprenylphenol 6-hydroxylase [Bartonella tamiae]|uniref:2-polyprenylphenol 6-hydroxylase n=1 Tax=Bartonella tamiae Th239 TaxID=1094558 RepID=J1K152_9HYPH|nr:2-polyprenylphenol 6-hydroxylase [Bartonella tamiae]EJF91172.1 2-polyprenylphenol 6-hydroxylase [Bartonella tamiae Th239]EJF93163.1 2-polyprenylphenol 6-hydroxylase [Bartonella tamiae Th307]
MGKITATLRLMRAGWILAREGVLSALPSDGLQGPPALAHKIAKWIARPKAKNVKRSENMSRAMNKLGPSYIKLGQFLATRPDIVGSEVAKDLAQLQDRVYTFPHELAVAQIEGSLGRKIDDIFVEFKPAIAAASMAQVHPAIIKNPDGTLRNVAVKVIRPGVRVRFSKDLQSFYMVAQIQERYVPASRRLHPVDVVDMLAQSTKIEMDLRLEAAALSELGENSAQDPGFRVPIVDWERTGRDVLTMEWIEGTKMSDIDALKAQGFDLNALAVTLMQSFLRHSLRDGFFHADMHPGNLFVDHDGCIVAVDLGITGRLGKKEKYFLAEILYGFITRDYMRVARVHFEAGYVPHHHDIESFAQANRAIGEPIHGQSAETISMAKLLTLLFEVTELFDMETRPELLLLQKTMVVVEGVARSLNPHFNMWQASEPVVKEWIAKNMGPVGILKDLNESAQSLLTLARKTPELTESFQRIQKSMDQMAQEGLILGDATVKKLANAHAKNNKFGRYALIIIAICLVIITFRFL